MEGYFWWFYSDSVSVKIVIETNVKVNALTDKGMRLYEIVYFLFGVRNAADVHELQLYFAA